MKNNDNKSKNLYDIEKDKSKGIGFKNLATGESPIFTTNEKGEIEFEIEVPVSKESVEEKKNKKRKKEIKSNKEEVEIEETEVDEEQEDEEVEEYADDEEDAPGFFQTLKTIVRIIVVTVVIIALIVVIWGLASPSFNIKKISVGDTLKVDREEILKIASGDIGYNIFTADFGKLKNQMEKLPYVYKVEFTRNLPDELYIEVLERNEMFKVLKDDSMMLIDQYGYVMSIESGDSYDVPLVYGIDQNNYAVGDTLNGTDITKFKNLKYFIEVAQSIDFEHKISSIDYTNSTDLAFYIKDLDINISYGTIDKNIINDKMIYLKEIINTCIERNFKGELDISSDNYLENAILKKKI